MQKALTRQHPSENDCFADDAVEDAEEPDTSLSTVSIGGRLLCNLRFVDEINLLGCCEEELRQLTERLEKTAAPTKAKFSSTALSQDHLPTSMEKQRHQFSYKD